MNLKLIENKLSSAQAELTMLLAQSSKKRKENRARIDELAVNIEVWNAMIENHKNYIKRLINNSSIGEKFKDRTFENFKVDESNYESFRTCKKYADNFEQVKHQVKNSLIISGDNGIGKTHLAVAIAHEVMSNGISVYFATAPTLFEKLRDELFFDGKKPIHKMTVNAELLIIDDLGKEKSSEWTSETLYKIVNDRYENKLPVIITTNLTKNEIEKRYNKAVTSRLFGTSEFMNAVGKDRRLQDED